MALVTIGIPVYNEEKYLRETIESAICQTVSDIEIIISDNASTDKSFEIANEYTKNDPRVHAVRQKENLGPINNFRYLLDKANAPYFVWLGGHDIFVNDYLEKAIEYLEANPCTVMVYPKGAEFIDVDSSYIKSDACSDIDTSGIEKPLDRVRYIIENLSVCTNIHGVFRVKVLRQLPFEKVIGPDFLMLTMTGLYGHISSIVTTGVCRRNIHKEDEVEVEKRREKVGVFSRKQDESPYKKLVELHSHYIKKSMLVQHIDDLFSAYNIRKTLSKKFGVK